MDYFSINTFDFIGNTSRTRRLALLPAGIKRN